MIIVCLFSTRCSACREVHEWIFFPGDGCVDAVTRIVLTLTIFLCMDHFICLICRMICSTGPDIITLLYLAVKHFSLLKSVCVYICADAKVCCSSHPLYPSGCHQQIDQKLIHVMSQRYFSSFLFVYLLLHACRQMAECMEGSKNQLSSAQDKVNVATRAS